MSDIEEFREGSGEAFSRIYRHFRKPIARYVQVRVSSVEIAEDLIQEIFLRVFRARGTYLPEYKFSTWLWTIARNTLIDHLRVRSSPVEGDVSVEEITCERDGAEALMIKKDRRRMLLGLIRPLGRLQKRVLWLRAVHQLSYGEIAAALGLSLSAVKGLAYRAKLALAPLAAGSSVLLTI